MREELSSELTRNKCLGYCRAFTDEHNKLFGAESRHDKEICKDPKLPIKCKCKWSL